MTSLTKEETGWMRSAAPGKFLELTRELQQRNEEALARIIPQLAPPYGSHPLNRQATAMLMLAAALTETLAGRAASIQTALGKLSQEKDRLPEETALLWRKADAMRRTLFDPERGMLVRVYILHALEPGGPEENVTQQELKRGWEETVAEAKTASRRHNPETFDLTANLLPPRTTVKSGGKNLKGWNHARFNPEEAKAAVLDIIKAMEEGRKYLRERSS